MRYLRSSTRRRSLARSAKRSAERTTRSAVGSGVERPARAVEMAAGIDLISDGAGAAFSFRSGRAGGAGGRGGGVRSEEHTSELQSRGQLVCRLLLAKRKYI